MARAHIGLGANLGEREATIRRAVALLEERDGIVVAEVSSLRETEPVGHVDQPPFLNGVVVVDSELSPRALLGELLSIEQELGRTRVGPRYGPRSIDLDLLLYGTVVLSEPGLDVPHPHLHQRGFVLEPLVELDPGLVVPGRGRVDALLKASRLSP